MIRGEELKKTTAKKTKSPDPKTGHCRPDTGLVNSRSVHGAERDFLVIVWNVIL